MAVPLEIDHDENHTLGPAPDVVPVLRAVDLSMRFGGVTALDSVTVDFRPGEVCGLIGPNGAGKTTLFDALSGLRTPTRGRVEYDGRDITRRSATWRARHGIRRTFQRQQTFGWLSVEENVLTALEWHGGGGGVLADLAALPTRRAREAARRERARDVIAACGLSEVADEPAGKLPLGKARLVELARAVADRPRVLLLDEPTSGLEESEAAKLGEIIVRMGAEESCTVVLVEHDVAFVMAQCHRIVALHLGRVIAEGPPADIRSDAAVCAAYLG